MNKVKVRFLTIASLVVMLIAVLALAVCSVIPRRTAQAVTEVEYEPSAVFAAGVGGEVGASEGDTSYIEFSLADGGKTHFRRDLALKWFSADDSAESASSAVKPGKANYFSMQFSFPSVDFETFTIEFQSDEENITKDAQAVNSLIFEKTAGGGLTVRVKNASQQDLENTDPALDSGTVAADSVSNDFTLTFAEATDADAVAGDFKIVLQCGGAQVLESRFTNIGGNYLEYRSSAATTPNTPITFTAELPEGAAEGATQSVLMKSLNGQSFALTEGRVQDNIAPVLVLNEEVHAFTLGRQFSLAYETIDVCDDTVSVSRYYYMAAKNEDGSYIAPDASEEDDYDYSTLGTSTHFMPVTETPAGQPPVEYVSIYFELQDGRTDDESNLISETVYLTWYAAPGSDTVETRNGCDYIRVDRSEKGPAYTGLTAMPGDTAAGTENGNVTDEGGANTYGTAVEAYRTALEAAAENTSAGTGAYLYMPSLRGLIYSNFADYRNLQFTVCYYQETQADGDTASSESGLSYNELRFEVDKDGWYRIRIFATDASSNAMKYYNKDGDLVDVTTSNVWDIPNIPEFRVHIGYNGASIEDPGSQDYGYRDRTYTISDFDIIALAGYVEDYALYYFDSDYLAEGQTMPSYDDFVENAEQYFTDTYKASMVRINEYNSDVTEDDENWDDTDNAYNWNPSSSRSFVPQRSGIYVVELTVTDPNRPGTTETAYMAIEVRNPVDIIPGQSQWLQNNITSVVLFAVSAVLAIVIVVLFVVKPSNKKVKEIDLEKLKGRPKNVNKKDDQ